jgi:tetratricopeptide (TPR) repeat protein
VSLAEGLGVRAYLALWTANLGEGLLAAGQVERARATGQRALELALAHRERGHQAWALKLLGDVAAHGEQPEVARALELYGKALEQAEALGMRPLAALVHLGLGTLYHHTADWERTEEHLTTAVRQFRAMDMRFWAARAAEQLRELGRLVIVSPDEPELAEYLRREFAGTRVTVIVDRRRDDAPPPAGAERRHRPEVGEALRARGITVVRDAAPSA